MYLQIWQVANTGMDQASAPPIFMGRKALPFSLSYLICKLNYYPDSGLVACFWHRLCKTLIFREYLPCLFLD